MTSPIIRTVPLEDLRPAPYNPRKIDPAALAGLQASLETFSVVEPIIWNERSGHVVGGHQRLRILRSQRVREAAVVVVDLSDVEERALNLALNNPHAAGRFDATRLGDLLAEIRAGRADVYDRLRFGALREDFADLLGPRPALDAGADVLIARPAKPATRRGDRWTLGTHVLACGDGRDRRALEALLGEERVDCALVMPPPVTLADWFAGWLAALPWAEYSTFYAFVPEVDLHHVRAALDEHGLSWGDYLVWVRAGAAAAGCDFTPAMEMVLYGWATRHRWFGPRTRTNVIEIERPAAAAAYPQLRPGALLEGFLADGSPDGALVLDAFAGTGDVLVACAATDRRCRALEADRGLCDVIVARWEALTGRKAERA